MNRRFEFKVYNRKTKRRITSIRTQYSLKDAKIYAKEYAKENKIPLSDFEIKRFNT